MDWFGSSRKKESEDYEKEYLARYKNQKKVKPKKRVSKQLDPELKTDGNKEPEPLSTKFESAKQEYNVTIKNLMDAKKSIERYKRRYSKIK